MGDYLIIAVPVLCILTAVGYLAACAGAERWLTIRDWVGVQLQCGYHNASRDAEEIAGRQLWARQELASGAQADTRQLRARYSNVPPWEE